MAHITHNKQSKKLFSTVTVFILLLPLLFHTGHLLAHDNFCGRSFMFTRPLYAYQPLARAAINNLICAREQKQGTTITATPAYQHSRKNTKTNNYFAPVEKDNLQVAGDMAAADTICQRDIRAEWLNLPANYTNQFHIKPQQMQTGMQLAYHQELRPITQTRFFKDTYLSIIAPITYTKNKLEIVGDSETNTSNQFPISLTQAFSNPSWHAAKIASKTEKTELAELKIKWGMFFLQEEFNQIGYYFGLSFPTAKRQRPTYWFNATNGYNGHFGVNGGVHGQLILNRDPSRCAVCFFASLDDLLLVKNHQWRIFDLQKKPWSRYMLYNSQSTNSCEAQTVPGINILTQKVSVNPYNMVDLSAGWRILTRHCELEIGYNLWGHTEEKLELTLDAKRKINNNKKWGIAGSEPGTTASKSSIANRIPENYDTDNAGAPLFIPIKECDIDLSSAAAGSAINHAAHVAFTVRTTGEKSNGIFSIGAFAEYPQKNAALTNWGIWGTAGASF